MSGLAGNRKRAADREIREDAVTAPMILAWQTLL